MKKIEVIQKQACFVKENKRPRETNVGGKENVAFLTTKPKSVEKRSTSLKRQRDHGKPISGMQVKLMTENESIL